jgi:hypothetical protein
MNPELKKAISNEISYLGESELVLGYNRAETKDVKSIVAEIQSHRTQFENNRVSSIGCAAFASQETWRSITEASEQAARDILLEGSDLLSEATELTRKADEARRIAEEKSRFLQASWTEFQSLPGKAERSTSQLANLKAEREKLDLSKLNADFSDHYKKLLAGATQDNLVLALHAGVIATRELRLEVIGQLERDLEKELAELRAKSKTLARKLGQKANI